eukprot:jgi/Botrbrau1/8853/Bobra.50_2s0012.1
MGLRPFSPPQHPCLPDQCGIVKLSVIGCLPTCLRRKSLRGKAQGPLILEPIISYSCQRFSLGQRRVHFVSPGVLCLSGKTNDAVSSQDSDDTQLRIEFALPRRSRQVSFTCNVCDGRTERMVNPRAWDKGMVFVQCAHCNAWHKIRDEAGLVEEIRFVDEPAAAKPDSNVDELEFDHDVHNLVKLTRDEQSDINTSS